MLDGLRGIGLADERSATVLRVNDKVIVLLAVRAILFLHCAYLIHLILLRTRGGRVDCGNRLHVSEYGQSFMQNKMTKSRSLRCDSAINYNTTIQSHPTVLLATVLPSHYHPFIFLNCINLNCWQDHNRPFTTHMNRSK